MKRILVPVDFSPAMEGVLALAREMARAFDAELHLVHVREITSASGFPGGDGRLPGIGMPEMGMAGGMPVAPAEVWPIRLTNAGKSRLTGLQEELSGRGLRAFAHEREGTVVEEILQDRRGTFGQSHRDGLAWPRPGLQLARRERD